MVQIRFLEPKEAWVRLRAASFWSTLQPAEARERYGSPTRSREQIWADIEHGFTSFTIKERQALHKVAEEADRIWRRQFGFTLPPIPIALGRWPARYDWGYPYTVSDMIVVPDSMTETLSVITFLHEALHIWQRSNPTLFQDAYRHYWGFTYSSAAWVVPPPLQSQWVSNPDGWDNHHWTWTDPHTEQPWCLLCLLHPRTHVPYARGVAVDPATGSLQPQGVLEETTLRHIFGPIQQLYHPHEILAKHLEIWLQGDPADVPAFWRRVFQQVRPLRNE